VVVRQDLQVVKMPPEELNRRLQEQAQKDRPQRREERAVFIHHDGPKDADEVTKAQINLSNLMADLQEYSELHAGQFPPSLGELKSLADARPTDLTNPRGKPYVYIPGQSTQSRASYVLAYDPAGYRDAMGKTLALRLHVDGQVPFQPGETLCTIRQLLELQSPLVAEELKPPDNLRSTQPPDVNPLALVDWAVPDCAVGNANHSFYRICQATRWFRDGVGGVIIGPEAAGKNSDVYAAFCQQKAQKLKDLLALEAGFSEPKPSAKKLNNVDYDILEAAKETPLGIALVIQLRSIENGRCVCYWFHGSEKAFPEFRNAALGKAKLKP
jgi:hypothetical protein